MTYFNNKNEQYILNFPEKLDFNLTYFFIDEISRNVKIDTSITVITTINDSSSIFLNQCNLNSIPVIITTEENINKELKKVNSLYTLIVKHDSLLLKDLNNEFIQKFLNLKEPFIFASSPLQIPDKNIENYSILMIKGLNKYINSGLLFGLTSEIVKLYNILDNFDRSNTNFEYLNYIYRSVISHLYLVNKLKNSYLDSECKIFSSVLLSITNIKDNGEYKEILPCNFQNNFIFKGAF